MGHGDRFLVPYRMIEMDMGMVLCPNRINEMKKDEVRKKQNNLPEGDDGRTIVNMNVEGMPWYVPKDEENASGSRRTGHQEPLDKEQLRMYRWAALKAGLLVVLVFAVVFFLYILLCDTLLLH